MKKLTNILSENRFFVVIVKLFDFSEVGVHYCMLYYKRWTSPMSILMISEKSNVCSRDNKEQKTTSEKSHNCEYIYMISVFLVISFPTFAKENSVEDSLIANIGKKAKVIFYAENKADLNEIAKYDLNKLFAEVRKRSEKNFSNNEEVTLREVDGNLKNREVNTTVTPKKWLKNMNLNLFVGGSYASGGPSFLGSPQEAISGQFGKFNKYDFIYLNGKSSIMLGVGGFFDKQLYRKGKTDFSLRYGLGFDLISGRMKTTTSYSISGLPQIPITDYARLNDSLKANSNLRDSPYKTYFSPNLYTQVMPTFNILNGKGDKLFSIGIGLKAALNLAGLTTEARYFNSNNDNPNRIYPKFKTLQTAWVANIGYKYMNLFIQMQPDIGKTFFYRSATIENPVTINSQGTFSSYTIGLRFGK